MIRTPLFFFFLSLSLPVCLSVIPPTKHETNKGLEELGLAVGWCWQLHL